MPAIVVAGDVGGTKTHLGLYQLAENKLSSIRDHTYVTRDFPSLEATLTDFLADAGRVNAACFGVPGPVIDRVSHATNVPWDMREQAIASSLGGAATRLVNDLEATSYGLLQLEDSQFAVLATRREPSYRRQYRRYRRGNRAGRGCAGRNRRLLALPSPPRAAMRTSHRAARLRSSCSNSSRASSIT